MRQERGRQGSAEPEAAWGCQPKSGTVCTLPPSHAPAVAPICSDRLVADRRRLYLLLLLCVFVCMLGLTAAELHQARVCGCMEISARSEE